MDNPSRARQDALEPGREGSGLGSAYEIRMRYGNIGIGAQTPQPCYGRAGGAEESCLPAGEIDALEDSSQFAISHGARRVRSQEKDARSEYFGYFDARSGPDGRIATLLSETLRYSPRLPFDFRFTVLEEDESLSLIHRHRMK
jgi:hypothetical protein